MPDTDGYPTDEELGQIITFGKDAEATLHVLSSIWWNADRQMVVKYKKKTIDLELHTGGWSGNEEIISYLQKTIFWMLYWDSTHRGGHYYFKKIPHGVVKC